MPTSSNNRSSAFRRSVRWLLVLAWCAVIFAASHRSNLRISDDDLVDLILRKGAHIAVFGILAALIAWALMLDMRSRRVLAISWLATLAYALSDEWHQSFITGRVGHVQDVFIDMIGATIAVAALMPRWKRPTNKGSST